MGYLIKAGLGLILFIGSIVVFNVKLVELMETGTCASGNTPYEIARPCPEGTGTDMLLVTGSVFTGLIGAGLFAFRGDPPWGRRRPSAGFFGLGTLAWGLFFTSTGVVMLYTGFANDTVGADGELAGKIVGFTFLFMGLPAVLIAVWTIAKSLRAPRRDESPAAAAPASSGLGALTETLGGWSKIGGSGGATVSPAANVTASGGDTIGKIERLQKLRESGAITKAEFDKEKAKILAQQ